MERTAARVRWQIAPECRDRLLGPEGLHLQQWLASGQASVVKNGPHRTVYRVALSGLQFYLKHYRLPTLRAWLRQLVRPAKARMEYERALAVAARGVPTVTPLGLGEDCSRRGPGESFLITRSLEDTQPLDAFVLATLPGFDTARRSRIRLHLAGELAKLIAQMHDAGIVHHDLYAGNVLVHLEANDRLRLYLVDLHAVHLGRPLNWRRSRDNLIMFTRWFLTHASRTDRLRFWHAYCRCRGPECGLQGGYDDAPPLRQFLDDRARDLEERTWSSLVRFWRHRDRRCRESNRYYRPIRTGFGFTSVVGMALRTLDSTALQSLLQDTDAPFGAPDRKLLKDSPSSTVTELKVSITGQARPAIYKRFRIKSWTIPWLSIFRPTKAIRSWSQGHGLYERGLPTPRPLAVFHRRRGILDCEGYLLTEKIENAVDLHGFLDHLQGLDAAAARRLLRRRIDLLGRWIRLLHKHQLSHRDLKAANLLLTGPDCQPHANGEPRFWFIDLVGLTRHRKLSRYRVVQNLARLNASFHAHAAITRTDRVRFLRCYLQWGLVGRGGWKKWWREIDQATLAKVTRNEHTGRPLA